MVVRSRQTFYIFAMKIPYAQIQFNEDFIPLSKRFDDIYFDQKQGIDESIHVFFKHNQIEERFQSHQREDKPFTILETGFGTGLNFLLVKDLYLKNSYTFPLKFISIEAYPISYEDLYQIHQKTNLDKNLLDNFLNQYKNLLPEQYPEKKEVDFSPHINLTVYFGDIAKEMTKIEETINAFFLDGHAPQKNPEMWNSNIIQEIRRLSIPTTTFSTFTAVGEIRRQLIKTGFTVEKVKGFGKKREMLKGKLL